MLFRIPNLPGGRQVYSGVKSVFDKTSPVGRSDIVNFRTTSLEVVFFEGRE